MAESTTVHVDHGRILLATAGRVLRQLRHDPRTVALLIAAPVLLIGLLAWVLSGQPGAFDRWGALLLGIFPLLVMFLVTSIATLRERTGGTLERLMTTPMNKFDFLGGYGVAFGAAAVVQAVISCAFTFGLFGLTIAAPVWAVLLICVLDALLGTSLGLFVSAFARTEFQAVQFLPAILLPQLLLCGIVAPTSSPASASGSPLGRPPVDLCRQRHATADRPLVDHRGGVARHSGPVRVHRGLRGGRRRYAASTHRVAPVQRRSATQALWCGCDEPSSEPVLPEVGVAGLPLDHLPVVGRQPQLAAADLDGHGPVDLVADLAALERLTVCGRDLVGHGSTIAGYGPGEPVGEPKAEVTGRFTSAAT